MDLIYGEFTNNRIEDINILQDYSFDAVVGIGEKDVNTFECRVQSYNHKCAIDNVLYVEYTEYGGIIDRIEHDSKSGEVVYKGRTWHGVLNSHVIQGRKSYDGELNAIIEKMIADTGMGWLFEVDIVPQEERTVETNLYSVSYKKLYDAIMELLQANGAKLICYYYDGKVHLGAVTGVDYSADEEFDTSKTPYRTGRTENTVNHLICLGQGEEQNRAVIHLFTDDVSQDLEHKYHIQPYTLIDNPKKDSDYILDKRNQVMFGKDEICEILDMPNSQIVTNYIPFNMGKIGAPDGKPSDWATQYFNKYYEDSEADDIDTNTGLVRKRKIKEIVRDEYRQLLTAPKDWATKYKEYYKLDSGKENKNYYRKKRGSHGEDIYANAQKGEYLATMNIGGGFTSVDERPESDLTEGDGIKWTEKTEKPDDWDEKYNTYYIASGTTGKAKVSALSIEKYTTEDIFDGINNLEHEKDKEHHTPLTPLDSTPPDWGWDFNKYVTRSKNALGKWVYTGIQGIPRQKFAKVTSKKAPRGWANDWGSYWVRVKEKTAKKAKFLTYGKGYYITASEAVRLNKKQKQSNEKPYPKYEPNVYYVKIDLEDEAPPFTNFYNKTITKNYTVNYGVYEKFSLSVAPKWDYPNKHYYIKELNTTPIFANGNYFEKVEDVRQIPDWGIKQYYYAVEDRYRRLVEKGIEELDKLNNKDTLSMDLELDSNYDVLDVLGLEDDVTGVPIHKPILRKIIKIKKDIMSVEYEMD